MFKFKNFLLKLLIVLFALIIFIFFSARSYSQIMFSNISNNFLRLHIVANSDSTEDQMLKYQIRDSVIEYLQPLFNNVQSKEEALAVLQDNVNNLQDLCYEIAHGMGYDYSISVSVGNYYFPTKEYSKITLPEGLYDALKIEIGESNGQNWWCVMFPSLCIIDTTNCSFSPDSDKLLQQNLGSEEYSIITNTDDLTCLKLKFKLIEIFENI